VYVVIGGKFRPVAFFQEFTDAKDAYHGVPGVFQKMFRTPLDGFCVALAWLYGPCEGQMSKFDNFFDSIEVPVTCRPANLRAYMRCFETGGSGGAKPPFEPASSLYPGLIPTSRQSMSPGSSSLGGSSSLSSSSTGASSGRSTLLSDMATKLRVDSPVSPHVSAIHQLVDGPLGKLVEAKNLASSSRNYILAGFIKDLEVKLTTLTRQLSSLEAEELACVATEDFARAAE